MPNARNLSPSVRRVAVIGLVLLLLSDLVIAVLRDAPEPVTVDFVSQGLVIQWAVALAVVAYVIGIERRGLASVGLKGPRWSDLWWGGSGLVAGILAFAVATVLVSQLGLGTAEAGVATLNRFPLALTVAIAVTAGITEEIVFRGYLFERLVDLTGRSWMAAGGSFLLFVAVHAPFWGAGATLQIAAWALVVTAIYWRTRRLLPCIVMHVLNDLWAFVLIPMLFDFSGA